MNWLNPFRRKPKTIIQTRASHKAQREADTLYDTTHRRLAREVGVQWRGRA